MRCNAKIMLSALVFLISPAIAHADAGTPILWTSIFHLLFGNAILGILEGILLIVVFSPKDPWTIGKMVLANYFSMICGLVLVCNVLRESFNTRPHFVYFHLPDVLIYAGIISFVITLIAEYPFCFWIFRKEQNRLRKTMLADLAAQVASYAILVPIYIFASSATGF